MDEDATLWPECRILVHELWRWSRSANKRRLNQARDWAMKQRRRRCGNTQPQGYPQPQGCRYPFRHFGGNTVGIPAQTAVLDERARPIFG